MYLLYSIRRICYEIYPCIYKRKSNINETFVISIDIFIIVEMVIIMATFLHFNKSFVILYFHKFIYLIASIMSNYKVYGISKWKCDFYCTSLVSNRNGHIGFYIDGVVLSLVCKVANSFTFCFLSFCKLVWAFESRMDTSRSTQRSYPNF